MDPPLLGSGSWDALSDSLWGGLYTAPAQKIVILWPDTGNMASFAPAEFATALAVLTDVAALLSDPDVTRGITKELAVVVE